MAGRPRLVHEGSPIIDDEGDDDGLAPPSSLWHIEVLDMESIYVHNLAR